MTRDQVAAAMAAAEREMQAAQLEHDGSARAVERYRQARAAVLQCDRLARVTSHVTASAETARATPRHDS